MRSLGVRRSASVSQVLGRNLEGTITKAEDIKKEWKDDFTSVEHLVLAMLDDARFGRKLLRDAGLDAAKLTAAIKDIRGGNRVQDQVPALSVVWGCSSAMPEYAECCVVMGFVHSVENSELLRRSL